MTTSLIKCKNHIELNYNDPTCTTCKSLSYHNSIYEGLSNKESLELYKKRTKEFLK
jgi:hypothetical protein